jgi:hypothetical protein
MKEYIFKVIFVLPLRFLACQEQVDNDNNC